MNEWWPPSFCRPHHKVHRQSHAGSLVCHHHSRLASNFVSCQSFVSNENWQTWPKCPGVLSCALPWCGVRGVRPWGRQGTRVLDLGVSVLHDTPLSEDDTDSHRIRRCGSSQSRCGNAYEHRSKLTSPFARSFHTSPRDPHAAHLQHPVSHSFDWRRPRIDHNEVHRFPRVLAGYGVDWNGYRQCTRHKWCCWSEVQSWSLAYLSWFDVSKIVVLLISRLLKYAS